MIRNYLIIAIRNLQRQLLYSFVNIMGLAVGLACSVVIFLYVWNEWRHDRHFKNSDRIYRVGISFFNMGQFANGPELLADVIREFPGLETFTRFQKNDEGLIRVHNEDYREVVYHADSSFFDVFSYTLVKGDAAGVLKEPNSAVLTTSLAIKYFGTDKVIGEIIEVGKERTPYRITGLVADSNKPTHLKANIWLSLNLPTDRKYYWTSASVYNYLLLSPQTSSEQLDKFLNDVIEKHVFPNSGAQQEGTTFEQYVKDPNSVKFIIQPLEEIYLQSKLALEVSPGGNKTNIAIFAGIAVIILALAAVNFVNLSTARASRRAKEVGIRKSLGTSKQNLIAQFLLESIIISLISMCIALGLAELFGFIFFWITGEELAVSVISNSTSLLAMFGFSMLVGVVAGIYPALYMTHFETARVIKGSSALPASSFLRSSLIVFQFSVSIGLIITTLIIVRQMNYMAVKDLGFRQDNVLTIDNLWMMKGHEAEFRDFIKQQGGVVDASLHSGEPGSKAVFTFYTYQPTTLNEPLTINTYFGDDAFVGLMGFRLLSGRDFNKDLASDTASVILNESAVRALGLKDPIGVEVNKGFRVIGVVSDFHWESLRSEIQPIAIQYRGERMPNLPYHQLAVHFNQNPTELLKKAEARWKQIVPDEPFTYHYMNENFGKILKKESVLAKAITFFTGLAIFISCLGLFGLSAYTTETRTKEIGIRKVLGSSASGIVIMLTKQFTKLILISIFIAGPLVMWAAEQWLQGFAYRTTLPLWIYLLGGMAGLLISCCTVLFHTLRASKSNPVDTLKYE